MIEHDECYVSWFNETSKGWSLICCWQRGLSHRTPKIPERLFLFPRSRIRFRLLLILKRNFFARQNILLRSDKLSREIQRGDGRKSHLGYTKKIENYVSRQPRYFYFLEFAFLPYELHWREKNGPARITHKLVKKGHITWLASVTSWLVDVTSTLRIY